MGVWLKETKQDLRIKLMLFIISPFLSFLYSLRTIKTRSSYLVFFLFAIFFGMAFSVGNIRIENSIDGVSYRAKFEEYKHISRHEFVGDFKEFLSFDYGKKDFYFDTVAFYISRITDNYHVMFMFFAIVFSFTSLKCFKLFTEEDNFDVSFSSYILAYLFMINQIFNINGMRMWTAAWIGVYAILQIFGNKKDHRYFLLLLVTPFFHVSFWILIAVVILAYLFKQYEKVWIAMFFISFFIGALAFELIQYISNYLPSVLQQMIWNYTNSTYVQSRSTGSGLYYTVSTFFSISTKIYMNFIVYLFIRNSKEIRANYKSEGLYLFLLFYMTFVNFTSSVPSLGGRYMTLAYPIIAYIWLVNFKDVKYKVMMYVMPLVFLFSFYRSVGLYRTVLDPAFIISSPFYLIYKYLIIF